MQPDYISPLFTLPPMPRNSEAFNAHAQTEDGEVGGAIDPVHCTRLEQRFDGRSSIEAPELPATNLNPRYS